MHRNFVALVFLALLALAGGVTFTLSRAAPAGGSDPLSPEAERKTLRLADEQLTIELVAAEPAVVSPVAMAWDAAGRLFVAEMDDYPVGPDKGRIRLLEDRNGDGVYETSRVFADGIAFPTSVLPYRDGVFVTSAPDLLFLADTDGDGRADKREVVLTGFNPGNQQLRANGLLWGADNWIHGANGRSGGELRRPEDPPEKAVSINGRDFRFRPDTHEVEATTGQSQFGLGRDDWGERFLSWNTIVLRHALLSPEVLDRYPQLTNLAARDIADPNDNTRIYAISPTPQTFSGEPIDFYNAMCGLTIFRGDALGPEFVGDAFVGESLRNLVHRRKLVPDGPTFVSKRVYPDREFLASTDPWFHPVFLTTGPDGALYVADFYRRWVEHPEWLAGKPDVGKIDWREGSSHGRIWRIRRRDVPRRFEPLAKATPRELVKVLGDPNGWRRDTAQRLLIEPTKDAKEPAVVRLWKVAFANPNSLARVHSLWTLSLLTAPDVSVQTHALGDDDAHVRRQAARIAGLTLLHPDQYLEDEIPALRAALLRLAEDSDTAVRFEAALAVGPLQGSDKDLAVARLAKHLGESMWDEVALQIALGDAAWSFLQSQIEGKPALLTGPSAEEQKLLETLGLLVGRRHELVELLGCLKLVAERADVADPAGVLALSAGLAQGLSDEGIPLRKLEPNDALSDFNVTSAEFSKLLARAEKVALDSDAPMGGRRAALILLTHAGTAGDPAELAPLMALDQPPEISSAAADCLARLADTALAEKLLAGWTGYSASTRRVLESAALRSQVATVALLGAIENGTILPLELEAAVRDLLVHLPEEQLRKRAAKALAAAIPADREKVLDDYDEALKLKGDRKHGGSLVAQHCLTCHQIQGRGKRIGPDLSGIGSHPKEQLLVSLLDPSRQASPDFLAYTLVTVDGQILSGLIVSETATSVTLRRAEGNDEIVPRSNIEVLKAAGKSLMPDGFEQKLSPQDVADVLAFLSRPDAQLLVAPAETKP